MLAVDAFSLSRFALPCDYGLYRVGTSNEMPVECKENQMQELYKRWRLHRHERLRTLPRSLALRLQVRASTLLVLLPPLTLVRSNLIHVQYPRARSFPTAS